MFFFLILLSLPSDRCRRRHLFSFVRALVFLARLPGFMLRSRPAQAHINAHHFRCICTSKSVAVRTNSERFFFIPFNFLCGTTHASLHQVPRTKEENSKITPADFSGGCYMLSVFDGTSSLARTIRHSAHMGMIRSHVMILIALDLCSY